MAWGPKTQLANAALRIRVIDLPQAFLPTRGDWGHTAGIEVHSPIACSPPRLTLPPYLLALTFVDRLSKGAGSGERGEARWCAGAGLPMIGGHWVQNGPAKKGGG